MSRAGRVKLLLAAAMLDAALNHFMEPIIENSRLVAISHGCHSPRCFQLKWVFE